MSAGPSLRARWRALSAALDAPHEPARGWERRLLRAYAGPLRAYHATPHILFLLAEIDRHAARIEDPLRLRLAAFFHDFFYRTWRRDNERRSADAASAALSAFGADPQLRARVHRLILWTAGHEPPAEADADDRLFLDMDLAVLGFPPAAYDRYARQVRREYFWVAPRAYRQGRSAFLAAMAARPRTFNTDAYEGELGEQARANMRRELERLGGA
jgi:predicted metal-dependent HD superfamily phosphohydrolase